MRSNIQKIMGLAILAFILNLSFSCKKDDEYKPSVMGSWVRDIGSEDIIPIQLTFFYNDLFEWIPLIPTDNHTRSAAKYTFKDGIITITNDPDCPGAGKYNGVLKGTTLTISVIEDVCAQRIAGLVGVWDRKDMMIDASVRGWWQKSVTIADTLREIVLLPQQNGVFEWLISKETSDYKSQFGKYVIGPDCIAFYNFLDCSSIVGYYSYTITDQKQLVLSTARDHCSLRIPAIVGTWSLQQSF